MRAAEKVRPRWRACDIAVLAIDTTVEQQNQYKIPIKFVPSTVLVIVFGIRRSCSRRQLQQL